jgi:gamma-glutamylcyclotransferase (GGCT)/AIG2-like uncharacterized protein YtfP
VGTLVFVYGTLMRGGCHHERLAAARYQGAACTPPTYELVDLGPYPALVARGATAVSGELFHVDDATLEALDELEGHPHLYQRRRVMLEGGIAAEAYLMDEAHGPPIPSGDWRKR